MTLYETEKFNFNINYNPEIQRIMLWINAPVFNGNTPIGLVGTGIDLTEFVETIYRNYKEKAELYFFNASDEITGARDVSLITNKVKLNETLGEAGAEIIARAKELEENQIISFSLPEGEIAVGNLSTLGWYIVAIQKLGVFDIVYSTMTLVFLAMMAVIALIFFIFLVLIGWLVKPLNEMITKLDHIAKDWDLTEHVKVKHKDETGVLGNFFNLTFGKMKDLIFGIKKKQSPLPTQATNLRLT